MNITACQHLLAACRNNRVARLIHLSSIVVLPPRVTPEVTSRTFEYSREKDWYTRAKIATELRVLAARNHLEVCVVRPGIVYGPYMAWSRVAFWRLANFRVCLPDPRSCISRCYAVHAADVAALIHRCIRHQGMLPPLIHAVSPERLSWHDFYTEHARAVGMQDSTEPCPLSVLRSQVVAAQEPLLSRSIRWLGACPLLDPARSSPWFRSVATRVKASLPTPPSAPVHSQARARGIGTNPLWPSDFELKMYSSSGEFTPAQSGMDVGFSYRVRFADGCREAADWWMYRLPDLRPSDLASMRPLLPGSQAL
jgi:hypothetical protein